MEEEVEGSINSVLSDYIEVCLRHKSETVVYEAAHAIVNLRKTTTRELAPAISVLQLFCSNSKPTLRFAAVRTLNKVSMYCTYILKFEHYIEFYTFMVLGRYDTPSCYYSL